MYKELLARLKDQRESLDQSIVMLEEHIRFMESAPQDPKEIDYSFNGEAVELTQEAIDKINALGKSQQKFKVDFNIPVDTGHIEVIKGDSHDMELVKGLAPGMGEPITITGDPLQHKFKHVAKGILEPHVTQEGGIIFPNPTKDPLAHLFDEGETAHSISKPMDIDHLRYSAPAVVFPDAPPHGDLPEKVEEEIYCVFTIRNENSREVLQSHIYNTNAHERGDAMKFLRAQRDIISGWANEEFERKMDVGAYLTYKPEQADLDKTNEMGKVFKYYA